jgi:hypothetical protein
MIMPCMKSMSSFDGACSVPCVSAGNCFDGWPGAPGCTTLGLCCAEHSVALNNKTTVGKFFTITIRTNYHAANGISQFLRSAISTVPARFRRKKTKRTGIPQK